ncbi:MAG: hypothetical protein WD740_01355 [Anaerolineales bacterium]
MPKRFAILLTCLFALLLSACASGVPAGQTNSAPALDKTASTTPFQVTRPSATLTATQQPTAEPTALPTPVLSPTPDIRPQPDAWRSWPIVPQLSPWLAELYAAGLDLGNDPHRFSVAGDCQNIPEAFMGLYDNETRVTFRANEQYLWDTVNYFAGSWSRNGLAVDGGFNFPAVFSPLRADAAVCDANEDPLACELRSYKPAFIFISMEFVYTGRTSENYELYLRQAIEYALQQNVIPILLTKADNVEGNHAINLATAQVAYEYDLPLINWWRAAQPLEGHGIDWERDADSVPQGFHITEEQGWSTRSYIGLKTLDAFLRSLQVLHSGG